MSPLSGLTPLPRTHAPPFAWGILSLVLGAIGLLLFLLPILGLPIGACGLLFGLIGTTVAFRSGGVLLRWGLLGVALSATALAVNVAIAYAPGGYLPGRKVPPPWQPIPDRPYVPPPARPMQGRVSPPTNFGSTLPLRGSRLALRGLRVALRGPTVGVGPRLSGRLAG